MHGLCNEAEATWPRLPSPQEGVDWSLSAAFEFVLAFVRRLSINRKMIVGTVGRKLDVFRPLPPVYPNGK